MNDPNPTVHGTSQAASAIISQPPAYMRCSFNEIKTDMSNIHGLGLEHPMRLWVFKVCLLRLVYFLLDQIKYPTISRICTPGPGEDISCIAFNSDPFLP